MSDIKKKIYFANSNLKGCYQHKSSTTGLCNQKNQSSILGTSPNPGSSGRRALRRGLFSRQSLERVKTTGGFWMAHIRFYTTIILAPLESVTKLGTKFKGREKQTVLFKPRFVSWTIQCLNTATLQYIPKLLTISYISLSSSSANVNSAING